MAKISALTEATSIGNDDVFIITQSGTSKKIKKSILKDSIHDPFLVAERSYLKTVASGDRSKVIPEAFANFRFTENTNINSLRVSGSYIQLYIYWVLNTATANYLTIANSSGTMICYYIRESSGYKSGIEELTLQEFSGSGIEMKVTVNWDLLTDLVLQNTTEIELNVEKISSESMKYLDNKFDRAENQRFPFAQDTFRGLINDSKIDIRSLQIYYDNISDAYDSNGKLKEIYIGAFINNSSYSIVNLYIGATEICHYDGAPNLTGISEISLYEMNDSNIHAKMLINWDATGSLSLSPNILQTKIRESVLIEGLIRPLSNKIPFPFDQGLVYNETTHPKLLFTKFDFLFLNPSDRFNPDGSKKQFYFILIENNTSPDRLIIMINEVDDSSIINATIYGFITPHSSGGLVDMILTPENRPYYIKCTIDTDLLGTSSTFNFSSSTGLIDESVVDKGYELSKYLGIESISSNRFPHALDKAPQFKLKLSAQVEDINILILGDSLFGAIDLCQGNVLNLSNLPPACVTKTSYFHIWNNVVKNKPIYDRYDSSLNAFTELVGSWSAVDNFWDSPDWTAEYRGKGSLTRWTNTANASFRFSWDLDSFEKLNLITRKDIYGTTTATISISSGNGSVEILNDAGSWVEANGFVMDLYIDPSIATDGSGYCQSLSNWRYRMRRASSGSGPITVTVTKPNDSSRLFYWGTERYNGVTILFNNIARGGRGFSHFLKVYLNDIYLRKPDLILFELPITNECFGNASDSSLEHIVYEEMQDLIWGDRAGHINSNSMKTISSDWTDFELLIILPHLSATWIDSNGLLPLSANTSATELDIMNRAKNLILNKGDVEFIDMGNILIREGAKRGKSLYETFNGNSSIFDYMYNLTYDTVHQNSLGSRVWGEYLASLFYDII